MKIPSAPHVLTSEWLTYALRETGTINQAKVKSFEVTNLGDEQGITGQLVRVSLSYDINNENAPRTLIAKFPTTDPEELEIMFTLTYHYEREVRFYEKIASRVNLRTPLCYYSALNVDAREYVLLLEDLAPAHCGNWAAACSLAQAELAIRQIAEFHSIWWESPELTEMKWMPQWDRVQFSQLKEMYQRGWAPFLEKMGHKVPDKILELGDRLGKHIISVMAHIQEPPQTIAHFDYQLDNLFIAPPGSVTPFVVVDWQLLTFGRGTFDVAFFLGGNVNSKDRRAKELDLLRMYHTTLIENGVRNYTFDQCLYDYRLSMLYCLARFVIVIGTVSVSSEQERIYCETIVPRYIAAVVDLNADELLLN
jgi:aminoglycoside/choline kinase family phosphotransferase